MNYRVKKETGPTQNSRSFNSKHKAFPATQLILKKNVIFSYILLSLEDSAFLQTHVTSAPAFLVLSYMSHALLQDNFVQRKALPSGSHPAPTSACWLFLTYWFRINLIACSFSHIYIPLLNVFLDSFYAFLFPPPLYCNI